MTIGINFHSINLSIYNPENPDNVDDLLASNSIFDFGGQERFKPLIPKFLKGADGALLVFDLVNKQSLEQLNFWNDQLIEHAKGLEIPKLLVGSKSDLTFKSENKDQIVSDEMIRDFLRSKNLDGYFKTSALENYNVVEVFKILTNLMLKKHNSKYALL
jgi:small GTP-binding protein